MLEPFGRFELMLRLGAGHYAEVFEAVDPKCPEYDFAIKILRASFLDLPEARQIIERFTREAHVLIELTHPGLVKAREYGEINGRFYILMDKAKGKPLSQIIKEKGNFAWDDAIEIIRNLCETLDYLHSNGVIHRDLKPENIIVDDRNNKTIITDLGLAFIEGLESVTYSGYVMGTPPYMAPESFSKLRGEKKNYSPATDVYALGCILYEMITGEKLFDMDHQNEAYYVVVMRGAVLPNKWPKGVPEKFRVVLGSSVAKTIKDRFLTAGDFANALLELSKGQNVVLHHRLGKSYNKSHDPVWLTYTSINKINRLIIHQEYLWGGTSGGVFRLNMDSGRTWRFTTSEGLPNHEVNDLVITNSKGVFVATSQGLAISTDHANFQSDPNFRGKNCRSIAFEPDESLLIIADSNVYKIQNDYIVNLPKDYAGFGAVPYVIAVGSDNQPLLGTNSGLFQYDGKKWIRLPNDETNGLWIRVIKVDADGAIWLGTNRGVLKYFHEHWGRFTIADGLFSNNIKDILIQDTNTIWVATEGGLIVIKDGNCKKVHKDYSLRSIIWDPMGDGKLWIGTNSGLYQYDKLRINNFPEIGLIDNRVNAVFEDKKHTWFGTPTGLSYVPKQGNRQWKSIHSEKIGGGVNSICEYMGDLWFGTFVGGVYQLKWDVSKDDYTWNQNTIAENKLLSNEVNVVFHAHCFNELWVGTNQGISIWNSERWSVLKMQKELKFEKIIAFAEERFGCGIWCGTYGNGTFFWDGQHCTNYGIEHGLRGLIVMGIAAGNDGRMWFATDQGVYYCTEDRIFHRAHLPAEVGLVVHSVCVDQNGVVWFGTDKGVVSLNQNNQYNQYNQYNIYTTRDKLAGNQVRSIWQSETGRLWISTDQGVSSIE